MEILAVIAVLLLLVAGPVIAVNRDLLFHRSARKRAAAAVPLPFLIIPSSPGAANIVPAGVARPRAASRQPTQKPPRHPAQQQTQQQTQQRTQKPPQARTKAEPRSQTQPKPRSQWADPRADPRSDHPADLPAELPEDFSGEFPGELYDELRESQRAQPEAAAAPEAPEAPEAPFADLRPAVPHELADGMDESFQDELDEESEEPSPDATVVFHRPVDEPVQILPGRLRILSGETAGEDLRLFSRIGEPPQIVVGRETGPAHRHITLHSPTVSRRHARMDFADGHWTITNLSRTNPVLVNDRVLANGGSSRKLSDGVRIELGEVALRFLTS